MNFSGYTTKARICPWNIHPKYSNLLRKPVLFRRHRSAPGQWFTAKCQSWISVPTSARHPCVIPQCNLPAFSTTFAQRGLFDWQCGGLKYCKKSSLISFVRLDIIHHLCRLTWESVVSSPCVSTVVWPIRWLCNDGPQCSQYSGSEKSNYEHCVRTASVSHFPPPSVCG